ncbi:MULTISPECIES: hypothetical protein [Arenibacter]|uniref:hypothetical protein n=1 Tax=Arenibacter TaxID=178469 RepID=UPI0012FFE13C|nr:MULTISPECIES: hypothetical protein [Arenibacter]
MNILAILLLVFTNMSCNKSDDDNGLFINIATMSSEIPALNNCDSGKGTGTGTLINVDYSSSPGLVIEKIHIKTSWSNGEGGNAVDLTFENDGSIVEFGECIRYEELSWIEYEVRLEASDGTLSNPSTIRINKPSGAN